MVTNKKCIIFQISNSQGELYSLAIRSPHFKWVRDLSSFDKAFTVTPGNNGRLYIVVPAKSLLLALEVWSGNVTWQQSVGPLSSADSTPVIDSNGEIQKLSLHINNCSLLYYYLNELNSNFIYKVGFQSDHWTVFYIHFHRTVL